jgi:hypothetical protein
MNDLTADKMKKLFFHAIGEWHRREKNVQSWDDVERLFSFPDGVGDREFLKLAFYLQLINCYQWHEEDKSHMDNLSDTRLAGIKKRIDRSNQRRNNFIEFFDRKVLEWYQALPIQAKEDAPLHSETPGHILDRLTVIALKIHHLAGNPAAREKEQARKDKLRVLEEQWEDLSGCLESLIDDFKNGRKRMKVYTQSKIYGAPPATDAPSPQKADHHR